MSVRFGYSFPAIRGVQANREYFVSVCPMRLLPKIFLFNEDILAPEIRAQRRLNRARLPKISGYITNNRDSYAFSAITASLDGKIAFTPVTKDDDMRNIGMLQISMDAKFIINDGQHRRAAIEMALSEKPDIGDESIAVVFFLDPGLERCQQLFADLNRYVVRPSNSLGILYDHRDGHALLTKKIVGESGVFEGLVELEKTTLSARSRRLFTLSALYNATRDLLTPLEPESPQEAVEIAVQFWREATRHIKEWQLVQRGKITAGEVRQDFVHSHALALQAIARAGGELIAEYPNDWKKKLAPIAKIDWRRSNKTLWNGRAIIGGRISKGQQNVTLTTNAVKSVLHLLLSPEEQRMEDEFKGGNV